MREIISLQLGQCGNLIGQRFWKTICNEHSIDANGQYFGSDQRELERLDVFFTESSTARYVPRSLLIDLELNALDIVRTGEIGTLFHPNSYIFAQSGAGNNWSRGYYSNAFASCVMDYVRKQIEQTNALSGFQMYHSLGGGTGSGLGSRILECLDEQYSTNQYLNMTYSIWPSEKVSDVVVEPYNTILTFDKLIGNSMQSVCFDNEALYDCCVNSLKIAKPTYTDLNYLCSLLVSGLTSSIRFPGQLNSDVRKNMCNAIPFSRLHFFTTGFAPLHSVHMRDYVDLSVTQLTRQAFSVNNIMCSMKPEKVLYLAVDLIYRGTEISIKEMETIVNTLQVEYSESFVTWIPNNINGSVVNVSHKNFNRTVTMLGNTTGITDLFRRAEDNFRVMMKKAAYTHWYYKAGSNEQEFLESLANAEDLRREYESWAKDKTEKAAPQPEQAE